MIDPTQFDPASLGKRANAYVLDGLIQAAAWYAVVLFATAFLPEANARGYFIGLSFVAIVFLYEPLLVAYRGKTLGHQAFGIEICDLNGQRLSVARASWRFFIKCLLGWLSCLAMLGPRRQTHHDNATNSMALYVGKNRT